MVKWKGDFENDWLHCATVRAPDLIEKWNKKRDEKYVTKLTASNNIERMVSNLTMRVCQLNNEAEVKPSNLEEVNPFKKLFDPRYDQRVAPAKGFQTMLKHIFAEHFKTALIREKKWRT